MSLVWDVFPNGGSEMLVMLAMADWCNDHGESLHPSNDAVAEKCRISRPQAVKIIRKLTEDGYLEVIGNAFGGAPGTTKKYRVSIAKLKSVSRDTGITDDIHTGITGDTGIADDTGITQDSRRVSPAIPKPPVNHHISTSLRSVDKRTENRATQIAADFIPDATGISLAAELGVSVARELPQFIDYHTARGKPMKDWQASWRTWTRNAAKFAKQSAQPKQTQHQRNQAGIAASLFGAPMPGQYPTQVERLIEGEIVQ